MHKKTKHPQRRFWAFVLPAMASQLLTGFFIIVDGFFIGQTVGDAGLAAINLLWPLPAVILAAGLGIGSGGSVAMATALGRGDRQGALQARGNTVLALAAAVLALMGGCGSPFAPRCAGWARTAFCSAMRATTWSSLSSCARGRCSTAAERAFARHGPHVRRHGHHHLQPAGEHLPRLAVHHGVGAGACAARRWPPWPRSSPAPCWRPPALCSIEKCRCARASCGRTGGCCGASSLSACRRSGCRCPPACSSCSTTGSAWPSAASRPSPCTPSSATCWAVCSRFCPAWARGAQPLVSFCRGANDAAALGAIVRRALRLVCALGLALCAGSILLRAAIPPLFGASAATAQSAGTALVCAALSLPLWGVVRLFSSCFYAAGRTKLSLAFIFGDPLAVSPLCLYALPVWFSLDGVWLAAPAAQLLCWRRSPPSAPFCAAAAASSASETEC